MLVGKLFEEEQTFVRLYSQVGVVVRGKQTFFLFGLINALFNIGFSFDKFHFLLLIIAP